jgi:hypothetical protein
MKIVKALFGVVLLLLLVSTIAAASDFDWVQDFNIWARADMSGFKASLATRFQIGDAQISAVIGDVDNPADAYIALRLGEMSNLPPNRVITEYKSGKGWGVVAKNLGIKPGSPEFHALKQNHDLYGGDSGHGKGKSKGKGKKH